MEFYDPIVAQEELPKTESTNDNKTEEAVHKLEDEIDHAYSAVEAKFSTLWASASKNATDLQEKYKLDEHKKQVLDQLNSAKENINNRAKVKENLGQIEDQLKNLTTHMPEVDVKNLQTQATNALGSLDSTLELVEKQAGKYANQFATFFSGIVSVNLDAQASGTEKETIFKSPLNNKENYGTSRYENDLYHLHTTPTIYTTDELDDNDEIKKFSAESKTDEISDLLKKYPETLTKLMNDLVPVQISYERFWYRYFKTETKLKESEQKRKDLLNKREKKGKDEADEDDEDFTWDDDEEEAVDVAKDVKDAKDAKEFPQETPSTSQESAATGNDDDDDDDDDWE